MEAVRGFEKEPEGGRRCIRCFRLRLYKTAEYAAENGFDCFTTTLTISPMKNAALLNHLGQEAALEYGVRFLPSDFKKKDGYKRSQPMDFTGRISADALFRRLKEKRKKMRGRRQDEEIYHTA